MLTRRSFLSAIGALALGQIMSGCASSSSESLKVLLLKGSIPPQLLGAFVKQFSQKPKLDFKAEAKLQDLWNELENWQNPDTSRRSFFFFPAKPSVMVDLLTLGDYWLTEAIKNELIQPLSPHIEKLSGWQNLPSRWQNLVKRNSKGELDKTGQIWGVPYRWGCTMMVYQMEYFESLGWTPTDWKDLWREELRGKISLLNAPREVIGLTLKKLGYSDDLVDLNQVPELSSQLRSLHQQVKFYDGTNYLQPLILKDTKLAVGWSGDILPIIKRYPSLKAVIPMSGTSLWTDLWVQPKQAINSEKKSDLLEKWLDFCLQSKSASQISLFTSAASPVILGLEPEEIPLDIRNNFLLNIDPKILEKSYFLRPLSPETQQQYQSIWQKSFLL